MPKFSNFFIKIFFFLFFLLNVIGSALLAEDFLLGPSLPKVARDRDLRFDIPYDGILSRALSGAYKAGKRWASPKVVNEGPFLEHSSLGKKNKQSLFRPLPVVIVPKFTMTPEQSWELLSVSLKLSLPF